MRSICIAVFAIAGLSGIATGADKPNFSLYPRKVTHTEPSLTIEDTQTGTIAGDQHDTRTYTTDGKEISCQADGADVKGSATWDGEALQINSKASVQGMEILFKDRMSLGDDGKTLTDAVHIASPQGELDLTLVFDKQ